MSRAEKSIDVIEANKQNILHTVCIKSSVNIKAKLVFLGYVRCSPLWTTSLHFNITKVVDVISTSYFKHFIINRGTIGLSDSREVHTNVCMQAAMVFAQTKTHYLLIAQSTLMVYSYAFIYQQHVS